MHLSYSEATGFYTTQQQGATDNNEQSVTIMKDPHNNLNIHNAIILSCKDPQLFEKVYDENVGKYWRKIQEQEQLRLRNRMSDIQEESKEEKDEDDEEDEEEEEKEEIESNQENSTGMVFNAYQKNGGEIDIEEIN